MKLIHVAAAVLNQTPLDWQHNSANVRQAIQVARDRGAVVVCLPELCLTGYGCEDAFHAANTHQRAWASLRELVPETRRMVVSFGLPVLHQNRCSTARPWWPTLGSLGSSPSGFSPGMESIMNRAGSSPGRRARATNSLRRTATFSPSVTSTSRLAACGWASRFARTPGWRTGPARRWRAQ